MVYHGVAHKYEAYKDGMSNLPLQDFSQGDFSQAYSILPEYRRRIATLFSAHLKGYLGAEFDTIKDRVDSRLKVCLQEKESILAEIKTAETDKQTLETRMKEDYETLLHKFSSPYWNKLCMYYKEV